MEMFGNLVVNMVFRTRCKHCLCLYTFLSFAFTHTRTLTSFAKLTLPQIEILGMVGLLAFVSTPDRHPGGSVCLKCFAGMKKRSHEFVIKEEIKFANISKVREQGPLFSSNFAHGQRHTRNKKLIFISSMKFPFQRIQDQ